MSHVEMKAYLFVFLSVCARAHTHVCVQETMRQCEGGGQSSQFSPSTLPVPRN